MKVIDIKKKKLFPKITASTANSPANNDTITIIVLLSYLSERYPTRYWFIAPPMIKVNINIDTC